jgi:hypothetical protein
MTKRATATQAQVRRIVRAAIDAGLRVTRIISQPDGAIAVETDELPREDSPSIVNSWADR